MTHPPQNYRIASAGRRLCATFVNAIAIGMLIFVAHGVASMTAGAEDKEALMRAMLVALVFIFWALCGLTKSPGAMLFMLHRSSEDYQPLHCKASLLRSSPFLMLGVIAYFPSKILPQEIAPFHPPLFLIGGLGLLADGIAVIISGRSLLDRLFRTEMLQLSLPAHQMPTFFGGRLM